MTILRETEAAVDAMELGAIEEAPRFTFEYGTDAGPVPRARRYSEGRPIAFEYAVVGLLAEILDCLEAIRARRDET